MTRKDAFGVLLDKVRTGTAIKDDFEATWPEAANFEHTNAWHAYIGSIDAAKQFHDDLLPGWWFQIGTCCVSDDARVSPDYNDKAHRTRLIEQFPVTIDGEEWDRITDIDQRPAGHLARALLLADLTALIWIEEVNADRGNDRFQWVEQ